MKLFGTVAVHVSGEEILRQPRFWDRVRRAFGGEPDLRTGRVRAALEASAVVDAVRDALRSLGATNAVSLVIDELVVFRDLDGRPDDLGDLFLAFHEHAAVIGGGFDLLRLAVEHVEAGLHLVLEVQARGEHVRGEPAVRVLVSGRLRELEPRRGEDAAAYRARVEPLARDVGSIEVARLQFESFVTRVRDAIARAMPEATVAVGAAEARVQRPDPDRRPEAQARPEARNYDPYDHYYPDPMWPVMNALMWTSIFSMATPPPVVVLGHGGDPVGTADTPGIEHADPGPVEAGDPGDAGGADGGGDGGGVDGGGGSEGGFLDDGGGFDGGGFDGGGFDGGFD